jgi:hypothetical protein
MSARGGVAFQFVLSLHASLDYRIGGLVLVYDKINDEHLKENNFN